MSAAEPCYARSVSEMSGTSCRNFQAWERRNTSGKGTAEPKLNTTVHLDTTFMHIYTNLRDRCYLQEETKLIQTFYITAKNKNQWEEFNICWNAGQTLIMREFQISQTDDFIQLYGRNSNEIWEITTPPHAHKLYRTREKRRPTKLLWILWKCLYEIFVTDQLHLLEDSFILWFCSDVKSLQMLS
jgi:hypothetical protein